MKASKYLVLGAGPTGTHTARLLAEAGHAVTLASRRGGGSVHPGIEPISLDVLNVEALTERARDTAVIFNCAMPPYDRWPQEFPPLAAAVLTATVRSGASLVTVGNVYGYGRAPSPLSESLPMAPTTIKGRVRAQMWQDALASGARVCEVRGSDFLGHGAFSLFMALVLRRIVRGEPASFPGDHTLPHSWTFTVDVARTMVRAATNDASWGRAWHVPSHTLSVQALTEQIARLAAAPAPRLQRLTREQLEQLAKDDSILREVVEMVYLLERPSVLDSTETERVLGVHATALDAVLRDAIRG